MEKDETGTGGISEPELIGLLASLKVEPAPEADFESRFLEDLRERLARESVCCSARRLLWERIVQFVSNFGPRKLAYGASSLGLGVLAISFFALPKEQSGAGSVAANSPLSRLESSLAALRPSAGQAATACTTISVCEQKKAPYTDASLASGGFSTTFERSSAVSDTIPVNMGLDAHALDAFPSFSTAVGF